MDTSCSKMVFICTFNFHPVMLNLIIAVLPETQLQSHGLRYFSNKSLLKNSVGFKVGTFTRRVLSS